MVESRDMDARAWRQVGLESTRKAHGKLKTMQIVYKELLLVVTWVYTLGKTHRTVHLKWVHFIVGKLYITLAHDFKKCIRTSWSSAIAQNLGREGAEKKKPFPSNSSGRDWLSGEEGSKGPPRQ